MLSFLLLGLLLAVIVTAALMLSSQRDQMRELKQRLQDVQIEERRVFDFLHGLGEAFSAPTAEREINKLIVEGTTRILDAHGGALYLADRTRNLLTLGHMTKSCPPLLEIPPHIIEQATTTPIAIESYLHLHPISPGEGLIGEVWQNKNPVLLPTNPEDRRLDALRDTTLHTESAMITPLIYAGDNLGVLAVANGPMGAPFTSSDLEVFKAITEQSAFALYNAMVYSEAVEKRRLDHDIQTARDIQRILLPETSPHIPDYQISGTTLPARHVSGDYYDYIHVDDDRLGIVIADVSGKGVPASLIMAMCRSAIRTQAVGTTSAAEVLRRVNRQLYPDIREDMFISVAYVILNHKTKQITLSRAGHDAPFFYSHTDRSVTRLNPPGMAIGIDSGDVFDRVTADFSVNLESDDCLVLYTDGVTDAIDVNDMEFGVARAIQSIQTFAPKGAEAITQGLIDDVRSFIGTRPQYDDVTLIAIRRI